MNIFAQIKFPVTLVALVMSTLTCSVFLPPSGEADEFFGKLAVVLEIDVANALELTDQQRAKLEGLVKEREADAVELVMSTDDPAEQEAFRRKTEAEGLALLTEAQRTQLDAIISLRAAGLPLPKPEDPANVDTPDPEPTNPEPTDPAPTNPEQPPVAVAEPSPQPITQQPAPVTRSQGKLRFNFYSQQWGEVLQWFAEQADLSLVLDTVPLGTFNYTDDRDYTPDETIDLLNSVL
ncbi:MAG: hypothetical protein V3R99_09155 [Thermoguttaceae bacterium]